MVIGVIDVVNVIIRSVNCYQLSWVRGQWILWGVSHLSYRLWVVLPLLKVRFL